MQFKEIRSQLSLPLIAAPMFLVSGPELVLAACRSGVIGSFPSTNARSIKVYEQWLEQITQALATATPLSPASAVAPWAANLIVHSSYPRLQAELKLIEQYKPPIVITALGSPATVTQTVHGYGGLVLADVNTIDFARKAVQAGVDGLVLVCSGAGGHTGDVSAFVFVAEVRKFFAGLLVLAGGMSDGRAIRAAETLGADLAYMGTPFIATDESLAKAAYKQMVVAADYSDLVLSDSFTGANAYYLRQSIEQAGLNPDNLISKNKMDLSRSEDDVKAWKDIWSAGQGVGTIDKIQPARELISTLKQEYDSCLYGYDHSPSHSLN